MGAHGRPAGSLRFRPLKRRVLCQAGLCQRLQDPRAPARLDGPHRTKTPSEGAGIFQPPGERQKPSCSPAAESARRIPTRRRVPSQCCSCQVPLVVRNKDTVNKFFEVSFLGVEPTKSIARRAVTMPALFFSIQSSVSAVPYR